MNDVEQIAESTPATPAVVDNQEPSAEATGTAVESAPKAGTPESAFEALRKADSFKQVGKAPEKAEAAEPEAEAAATDTAPKSDPPPEAKPKAAAPKNGETRNKELASEIGEKLRERRALTDELGQLRAEKARLQTQPANGNQPASQPGKSAAVPGKPVAPTLAAITKEVGEEKAWEVYEERQAEYADKLSDWKMEQRTSQEAASKQHESAQQLVAEAIAKHGDFEEVAFADDLNVTDAMAAYLWKQGNVGLEMLYHLGQNKPEAAKIARLSQLDQIEALVGLKQKFTKDAPRGGSQNGAARQVSKASPPPDEVRGNNQAPIDPAKAALAKGSAGFGEFRRIEAEKRAAAFKPR